MQVSILPARRGLHWLADGFVIFRNRAALLGFLVLSYWLSMAVISAIPLIGQIIGLLLIPVFSVSLMNACRLLDRKEPLPPQVLFSGFHRNLQTLLILGVIYVVALLSILGITALFDGGLLFRIFVLDETPTGETADETLRIISSARMACILLIPVVLAFWFAPVLAAWRDMSAGKSLFFSLVACMRNWRPFLMYTLAAGVIGAFLPRLINGLLQRGGEGGNLLAPILISVMFILVLMPTLYASFYISYRDIFSDTKNAP